MQYVTKKFGSGVDVIIQSYALEMQISPYFESAQAGMLTDFCKGDDLDQIHADIHCLGMCVVGGLCVLQEPMMQSLGIMHKNRTTSILLRSNNQARDEKIIEKILTIHVDRVFQQLRDIENLQTWSDHCMRSANSHVNWNYIFERINRNSTLQRSLGQIIIRVLLKFRKDFLKC